MKLDYQVIVLLLCPPLAVVRRSGFELNTFEGVLVRGRRGRLVVTGHRRVWVCRTRLLVALHG